MFSIKNISFLYGILILSFFILTSAYYIEFFLNHEPCSLCLLERIPYFTSIVLIPIIIFKKEFIRVISLILLLAFIFGTLVAFYHVGIEIGFFQESFFCEVNSISKEQNALDLLNELKENKISCKDVPIRIIGRSLAEINFFISIILSFLMLRIYINEKN